MTLGLGALALTALAAFLARDVIGRNARPIIARGLRPLFVKAAVSHPVATAALAARRPREAAAIDRPVITRAVFRRPPGIGICPTSPGAIECADAR